MPMHWGSRFVSGAGINALTVSAFDPYSKQPELKHAAVEVSRAELPHELIAIARLAPDRKDLDRLQPLLGRFPLAALSLFGREHACLMLRARSDRPFDVDLIAELDGTFVEGRDLRSMSYDDPGRAISRKLWMERSGRMAAARLTGDTISVEWLKEQLQSETAVAPALALAPRPGLPSNATPRGRIVCNCLDVSEAEIRAVLARGADLSIVQRTLRCGTVCGSCVPELGRLCSGDGALSSVA